MKKLLRRASMAVLSVGLPCTGAWAANFPGEQDFFHDLPVVLSASRLSQPVSETPNAMTIIDRDMIVASGARNIADLFRLVPSMYVGYGSGHAPIVAYRGITDEYARRMQVLVDGRSIYLPIFGQVDWTELPLDIGDIERIEVIRGPSAASHGSNSVQGVINIFTRPAHGVPRAELSARYGSAGVADVAARFGGAAEQFDYRVTLATRGDTGFNPLPDVQSIPLNDDSRTHLVNASISYRVTSRDTLDVRLGYSDSTRQLGDLSTGWAASSLFTTLRDRKTQAGFQQLAWLHTFSADSDFQLNYYHKSRDMRDERYSAPCIGFCAPAALNAIASGSYPVSESADVHRHDAEMQHTLRTSPDNRVVWGIGAREDAASAPGNLRHAARWREYRLFAHDEWRITPESLLNIGAMAEKNALGQGRVSPRVSYNRHLTPRDTLRASISVAYRNPEMIEELGEQNVPLNNVAGRQWSWHPLSATGGLGPEKTVAREIGYIRQLDEAGSTLDLRAFHDQISNIIWVDLVADPNSIVSTKSFKSDFNAFHSGLEGTLKYNFGARSWLTANYAHQVAGATPSRISPVAAINASLQGYAYKYRETVPLNSASLLFSHAFREGLQFSSGFYHIDPVRSLDAGRMQPLTRYVDFRVAQRFGGKAEKTGGEVALVVRNALNDHYFDYSSQTRHKRQVYLNAMLRL